MPKNEQPMDGIDWSLTTWEGSRREQLRRWVALPLEQMIEAIEDMDEVAEHFRQMRETEKLSAGRSAQPASPASEAPAVRQTPPRYDSTD